MEKRDNELNGIEHRAIKGLEVRASAESDVHIGVLTGYAAVFDSDSEEFADWGNPWVERIQPGAFTRTLKENPDIAALWSHRSDMIVARTPDTLSLEEDDKGLKVEIHLVDTSVNRDLFKNVESGLVDSMSFGFKAREVKWKEGGDRDVRTLIDVDLFEVSPVVWPAYPDTSLAVRCREVFFKEQREIAQPHNHPESNESNKAPLRRLWAARLG